MSSDANQTDHIENVSDTALWVATYRAQESKRKDALFKDPLAGLLAGTRGEQIAKRMAFRKVMYWVMVVRTVAIDRLVKDAIAAGADTILNLGTGLDTRPYRLDLPKDLRWVEVDFPGIIRLKNAKLNREAPRCRLERYEADLSNDAARRDVLARIAKDSKSITVITEGVIPYLTSEQAGALARDLHAVPEIKHWIQDYREGSFANAMPASWKKKMKDSPFRFGEKDWFGFFARYGWVIHARILAADESTRIGRPLPFIFPLSLFFWMMPKDKREQMRIASGYVMLKKA